MQKMTDPALPGFPFYHWLVSSATRVHWLSWVLLILALISAADAVSDYLSGNAVIEFGKSETILERAQNESAFKSAITFEAVRTAGIMALSWAFHAVWRALNRYDIFAPGQEFESLKDDKDS